MKLKFTFYVILRTDENRTQVLEMTFVFASLTSKSSENDTIVHVDNYVEIGDFFFLAAKNRHLIRFYDRENIAIQIAEILK